MLTPKLKIFLVTIGAILVVASFSFLRFSEKSNLPVQAPLSDPISKATLYREKQPEKFNLGQFIVERRGDGVLKGVSRDLFSIYKNGIKLADVDNGSFNKVLNSGKPWEYFEPIAAFENEVYFLGICPSGIWGSCNRGVIAKFNVNTKKIEKFENSTETLAAILSNNLKFSQSVNDGNVYAIAVVDRVYSRIHTYPTRWNCLSGAKSECQDIIFFR
ncbi:MAG: hypothetical protein QMD50_01825 [Patescibacteria group bacterium]|nr:hypothetical protein [Patescibacteria group bacterium]